MDRLTAIVKSLMAARNQSSTPPSPRSGATEVLRSILTLPENKFREGEMMIGRSLYDFIVKGSFLPLKLRRPLIMQYEISDEFLKFFDQNKTTEQ
ncbi:unnamed protein product [Trifolium pratense]|uniref:Uncharacterized protein n=1 Tax=Trifolium pratense TaxID=57577 RepID=A0ACB0J082_TRIPR|nr:unnamed protein product [Trifolium pratense]